MAKLKFYQDNSIIFSTIKVFRNIALFKDERFCWIIIENLRFYRRSYRLKLYGFVIMPTHLHLLFHLPLKEQDDGRAVIHPGVDKAVIHPNNRTSPAPARVLAGPASQRERYYFDFLRDFKSFSARQIIDILKKEHSTLLNQFKFSGPKNYQYKICRKSNYDFNIYSDRKFEEKLNYIHNNPLKAGLVDDLADYPWSSYQNYYLNNNSLLKIDY